MNKRITLWALVAGIATMTTAQQSFEISSRKDIQAKTISGEDGKTTDGQGKTYSFSNETEKTFSKRITVRAVPESKINRAPDTDYGTEVPIAEENFTKFSTGTLENPDINTDIKLANAEYPWTNVSPKYTILPEWGAENVYPAGGVACLNADEVTPFAHLSTPRLDVSGYGGIVILQFKARTLTGSSNGLIIEAAETFDMSPTWDFLGSAMCPEITDQWQTYEVMFYGGGGTTIFNLAESIPVAVYIDDVKVYQIDQYVATPVILPHSNYKGTSFDVNWKAVEGAEAYQLTVYSYNEETQESHYILENQRVEGTSYTVTGVESGATYYYTVRSVKGEHVSIVTKPAEVFDLEAPVLKPVDGIKDGVYTAEWSAVPSADVYNYWAFCERVAAAEGEFVVTDENFDGIKDSDGNETGWTLEEPSYNSYDELYLADLNQAGWKGLHYAPYTDYICVDGWHYAVGNGDAGLVSPELDLSKDGGKIKLSIKLYGEFAEGVDIDGNPYAEQTEAAIALFNYDEAKDDWIQAELIYPEGVKNKWNTFNVTLTKGTTRSVIGIYAVKAPGNLYIDDLKITQHYKKGESLTEAFLYKRYYDQTAMDVQIPERVYNCNITHKVSAVKSKSDNGALIRKESEFSKLEQVGIMVSSITSLTTQDASVKVVAGKLHITNPLAAQIYVYDMSGRLIYADKTGKENTILNRTESGVYLVKIGSKTIKVIY